MNILDDSWVMALYAKRLFTDVDGRNLPIVRFLLLTGVAVYFSIGKTASDDV